MLANTFLNDINLSLLDIIVFVLLICVLFFLFKYIKCKLKRYSTKKIISSLIIFFLTIISLILIASSIVFFYQTYMVKMLIPAIFGIILLVLVIVSYILVFEENGVN